jgi:hypothetical protein
VNADKIAAAYRAALKETIIVRRYTGAGPTRPHFDAEARGLASGYAPNELAGEVQQGDQRVLVLASDLIAKGFALPLTAADKVIVKGRELAILSPGQRTAPDGTVVVYELQARG